MIEIDPRRWSEFVVRARNLGDQFEVAGHHGLASLLYQMADHVEEAILRFVPPV
jgi:hypothetical protein